MNAGLFVYSVRLDVTTEWDLRHQTDVTVLHFWRMDRKCHRMLMVGLQCFCTNGFLIIGHGVHNEPASEAMSEAPSGCLQP